ncbi:phage head closure protein [Parafrankia sp. EUN1f]|uniref:phage head closure protein n=1 Tax=Parafrankia sp. EUN1f TaxID=102897 RepID=UPI0001C4572E|nr:phage head closure protein [Parafrankia sp. EUN1f]EFC78732.1 phage head-tail adaptor [Parafrankia sp. EUN1f]
MRITHRLNRELEVWRPATEDDGAGGQTVTQLPAGTVPAKVDEASAAERVLAAQAGAELTHVAYLEPEADVLRGDELRGGGQAFRVDSVVEPSSPRYRKASLVQVQAEPGDDLS